MGERGRDSSKIIDQFDLIDIGRENLTQQQKNAHSFQEHIEHSPDNSIWCFKLLFVDICCEAVDN